MRWVPENWFPFTEQNSLKKGSCDWGDDRDENKKEKEGVGAPYYVLIVGLRVCIRDISLRLDVSVFTFAALLRIKSSIHIRWFQAILTLQDF
jgi:hypothetical protein